MFESQSIIQLERKKSEEVYWLLWLQADYFLLESPSFSENVTTSLFWVKQHQPHCNENFSPCVHRMDIQFPSTPIKKKVLQPAEVWLFSMPEVWWVVNMRKHLLNSLLGWRFRYFSCAQVSAGSLLNCVKQLPCSHPLQESESELPQRQTAWHCVHTQQINVGPDPGYCGSDQKVNMLLSILGEAAIEPSWGHRAVLAADHVSYAELLLSPVAIIVCYHHWIARQFAVYSCALVSADLFIASGMDGLLLCFFYNAPRRFTL